MRLSVWMVALTLCATNWSFIEVAVAAPPAKGRPAARPVADDPDVYVRAVEGKIKQNWSIVKGNAKQTATILVTIGRAGDLKDAKIQHSSGSKDFDESVQAAARKAVPYPTLPKSFPDAVSIEISLTYDLKYQSSPPPAEPSAKKPEPIQPTTASPEPIEPTKGSPAPQPVAPTTVSPGSETPAAPTPAEPTVVSPAPEPTTVSPAEPTSPTTQAPATPGTAVDQPPAAPSSAEPGGAGGEPGASSGSEGSGTPGGASASGDAFDTTSGSGDSSSNSASGSSQPTSDPHLTKPAADSKSGF